MKLNKKWVYVAIALVLLFVVLRMFMREGYMITPEDDQRIEDYINSYQIDPINASIIKAETKEYIKQYFDKNGTAFKILQDYQVRAQRPRLIEGIEREFSYKRGSAESFGRRTILPPMGQPLMEAQKPMGPPQPAPPRELVPERRSLIPQMNGIRCLMKKPSGFECETF
jgi:hypothetical protein